MHQFAAGTQPGPSSAIRIRGWRAGGVESPLRAVIQPGERLLVCAAVRFPGRPADQRLWLTDSRYLFTRTEGPFNKLVISVPLSKSRLTVDSGMTCCLHLSWIDDSGQPGSESFRSESWKDNLRQGVAGGLAGGAIQGAGGAIPAQDEQLYATLADAVKAPASVRPVDLTDAAGTPLAGKLLWVVPLSLFAVALLAAAVYTFFSFQTKQAYETAPVCGSVAVPDCRLEQSAIVTSYRGAGGRNAFCDLSMRRPDGSTVTADLHTVDICASSPAGATMVLEYWRGSMTSVIPPSGPAQETEANPQYGWRLGYVVTGLLVLLWLIFGIAAVSTMPGSHARRTLLRGSARSAGYLN
jgi:hypothetical protein